MVKKVKATAKEEDQYIFQAIEIPVSKTEIFKRLRSMGSPVTLFGETDVLRYQRLRLAEKSHLHQDLEDTSTNNNYYKDMNLNEEEFRHNDEDEDDIKFMTSI